VSVPAPLGAAQTLCHGGAAPGVVVLPGSVRERARVEPWADHRVLEVPRPVASGLYRTYIWFVERKKRVNLPGLGEVDATVVGYRTSGENWNEYLADDGTVVRIKLVVTEIVRVDGQYDQDGNPVYLVKSANVTAVSAPEELRRQP
jgi:hypothetical protein